MNLHRFESMPKLFGFMILAFAQASVQAENNADLSSHISGFELDRNGLYAWTTAEQCAQIPLIEGKVIVVPERTQTKNSTVVRGCDFLTSSGSSPARDDAYVYFFSRGSLQRIPYSKVNESKGLPLPTPVDLPLGQPDPPLVIFAKRLYWIEGVNTTSVASCLADGNDRRVDAEISPTAFPVLRFMVHASADSVDFYVLERSIVDPLRGAALHAWVDSKSFRMTHLGTDFVDYGYYRKGSRAVMFAATAPLSQVDPTRSLVEIDPDTGNAAAGAVIYDTSKEMRDVAVDTARVFWTETYTAGIDTLKDIRMRPHRAETSAVIASQTVLAPGSEVVNLRADGANLYYIGPDVPGIRTIRDIALDPAPINDITAEHIEAVQAIQRLTPSPDVRLVAGKRTFARGYAKLTSESSELTGYGADAVLTARLNGAPLEGRVGSIGIADLTTTDTLDIKRRSLPDSFLFELPMEWVQPGTLELTMTVDPSILTVETETRDNNTVSSSVVIVSKGSPCLELVSTYFCLSSFTSGFTSADFPEFPQMLARAEALMPIRGLRTFMRDFEPIRLPGYSPPCFRNDEIPAVFRIMNFGFFFSGGAPSDLNCDAHLRVAMFPPDLSAVGSSGIGFAGVTNIVVEFGGDADAAYDNPRGGLNLAHEMGHSYNLLHVQNTDECGQVPAGPYAFPPYPPKPCWLGPNEPDAYFGFDPITRSIIPPDSAGELMSYADRTWPANTFWDFMLARLPNPRTAGIAAQEAQTARKSVPDHPLMALNGTVDGLTRHTQLMTIYTFAAGDAPLGGVEESANREAQALAENSPYFARQLGTSGQVLSDTPLLFSRGVEGSFVLYAFFQYVPLEPDASRLQIVGLGRILAERMITSAPPVSTAGTPIHDPVTDRLHFDWSASDPDSLLLRHTIQFSADGAQNWKTLLLDVPDVRASFNAAGLKGGSGALLRVLTSDGVRTATAVSVPFSLPIHPPILKISGVVPGARVGHGLPVELRANAFDSDDFEIPDSSIHWSLSGPRIVSGTGREFRLIDLEPGFHSATADAVDKDLLHAIRELTFEVLPPAIPDAAGALFDLDGIEMEKAYSDAAVIRIPIGEGQFITARLIHAGQKLHVILENLRLGAGDPPGSFAGLRIDIDASADTTATASDIAFFVSELGEVSVAVGDGLGSMPLLEAAPNGFSAAIHRGGLAWTAEIEIDESLIGGWSHATRMEIGQFSIAEPGDDRFWPSAAQHASPASWAPVQLGDLPPQINRPPVASAGGDQIAISASGETHGLSAEASYDPDGDTLTFNWTQIAGPVATLNGAQTAHPVFTLGELAAETAYRFRVVASDGQLLSEPAEVTLTFQPQLATLASVSEGILAYVLGHFGDRTGLDLNADGEVDGADYIQSRALALP